MADHKICTTCKKETFIDDFYNTKNKSSKDGKFSSCKKCHNKRTKKYKDQDIKRARDQYLKEVFKITLNDYENVFNEQKGSCAICGKPESYRAPSGKIRSLAVDHCHRTGKIRGLLCCKCNTTLGGFQDNKNILILAVEYLEKYGQ